MNFASIQMTKTLSKLESSLGKITPEQRAILDNLQAQINEQGRYYDVCSITLEDMREHGYDVTEENCLYVDKIAEKVEMNSDELWLGVEIWAKTYGIKNLENADNPEPDDVSDIPAAHTEVPPLLCSKCGNQIDGGYYNTPDGPFCCACWAKVPSKKKGKALADTLHGLASLGKMIK